MTADALYAGPARVLEIEEDARPHIALLGGSGERTVADWAIPFRYEPRVGDLLFVMGRSGRYWVTGIMHGTGRSQLAFRGDTELRASGALRVGGDGGVRIAGPEVGIETRDLHSEAEHAAQRLGTVDTTVTGTVDERAGACERSIDGEDEQLAGRHETVAQRVVKIDGGLLRLS